MTQPDLFQSEPAAPTPCCGTCVARNAIEMVGVGCCPFTNTLRAADDEACGQWFPMTQLRAALYGRGKAA